MTPSSRDVTVAGSSTIFVSRSQPLRLGNSFSPSEYNEFACHTKNEFLITILVRQTRGVL